MPSHVFVSDNQEVEHTIVVVFLRGGADGLTMLPPVEDDAYYHARPQLSISKGAAVELDGKFALHPELGSLAPLFHEGQLAFIHGAGSEDTTRSHFEAQDFMEHGGLAAGGWLGRFLRFRPHSTPSPLAAIAIGTAAPAMLRGAPAMAVVESFDAFSFGGERTPFLSELRHLYAMDTTELGVAGGHAMAAAERVAAFASTDYHPAHGAEYDDDLFGQGMGMIARLIRARAGVQAACIDLPGWDSHFASATLMGPLMARLARGLTAFAQDLGPDLARVTVVVMSEFGRRVRENASYGTDHGRGGLMCVMGGGIDGGRVHHDGFALGEDVLEGPGDVPVTYNYRDVIAAILARHAPDTGLGHVFPDYMVRPIELFA